MFNRHRPIQVLTLVLLAMNGPACAEEPAVSLTRDEAPDPEVLRKTRRLIQGTISEDEATREKSWAELKTMGNLAVPGLLALFRQPETTPAMSRSILIALGDAKDKRAGPVLLEALRAPKASVRRDAARALGDSGYTAAREPLEAMAADPTEDAEVRLFAAVAAAKMSSKKAIASLAAMLQDAQPEIRSRAVFALGKYGGLDQVETVAKALDDADQSVREDAVEALRGLALKPVWGPLVKATGDSNYKVRSAAMNALKDVTKRSFDTPQAWQQWWDQQKEK